MCWVDHIPREMGKAGVLRIILASFSVIFAVVKLGKCTMVSQPFVFQVQKLSQGSKTRVALPLTNILSSSSKFDAVIFSTFNFFLPLNRKVLFYSPLLCIVCYFSISLCLPICMLYSQHQTFVWVVCIGQVHAANYCVPPYTILVSIIHCQGLKGKFLLKNKFNKWGGLDFVSDSEQNLTQYQGVILFPLLPPK